MLDQELVQKAKIEIFRAVLEVIPKASVMGELAEALYDDDQYEEALEVCREGIAFHPDLLICRAVMAESLEALGRREEAREVIESARERTLQARAGLDRLTRLEEKLAGKDAAPEPDSDAAPVDLPSSTLAELYLRQGDQEAAVQVYRRLLDQDPDDPAIRERLGRILGRTEAPEKSTGGKKKLLRALERWLEASRLRAARSLS